MHVSPRHAVSPRRGEGWRSPTQNVAVQTEANVVAIFFFHQCGFYDPTTISEAAKKLFGTLP